MKKLKKLTLILSLIFIASILSCSDEDNEIIKNPDLVGVWQRSDFIENPDFNGYRENNDYRLFLKSDDSSYLTHAISYDDGTAISFALGLEWSTQDNQLTLIIDGEETNTHYSFNSDGQLILSKLTNFPFNKLD
jgi:hypothetical protein